MEFRILGPFEVREEGEALPLGGAKQRALLAVLLLHANEVVSADRLIDALWGERAPETAAHTLQVYVSQVRKALRTAGDEAREVLVTRPPGYLLRVQTNELDLEVFKEQVEQGRRAIAEGDPATATRLLTAGLDQWRGPPLDEFAYETFAQATIAKLEELRLSAIEDKIDANLALGRHSDLVGELQMLVGEHPLRDRLRAQYMLALYRSGRQAEALEAYREARRMLTDELGIDPAPELQRLERAILAQDPELEWPGLAAAVGSRDTPETKYAKTADGVHIAYQTVGEGPVDIAFVLGWTTHIELMWTEPRLERFLSRLAAFSRLILFDKRGMGLSDRVPDDRLPSLEVRMDDARAVLDAVGSERAIVMGFSEGGPMATLFAATYPERTIALVLFGTSACWRSTVDYPFPVPTDEQRDRYIERMERIWGTREFAAQEIRNWGAPTLASDDYTIGWLADYLRHAASPGAAIALERMNSGIDVRPALPAIHVPTLVLARDGDLMFTAEETNWMADQIHAARFVSFPGVDHFFWTGIQDDLLGEIERFVEEVGDKETDLDHVLATVMFTDIVGSTAKVAELGERGWGSLVDRHHGAVRALLGRYRGTEVDTAGDGFFATFDGPARGVRCAHAIGEAVRDFGLEVRAGVHTGEVERNAGKVGGIAVSVGAKIAALAAPSEVLVSQTVKDLVSGSGITFEDAGEHELKGVPDRWHLYRVLD
jgi:DNA-binding SARP family transcriptional activator/pimeloyl-ACP methyl ester carboxylesterase/class 3 adenylate cyclase